MVALYDMHCHLGFAQGAFEGWGGWNDSVAALCGTVTPQEYEALCKLDVPSNVKVGLGLHPHWIASGECGWESLEAFERLVAGAPYVCEVGLDFGRKCEGSFDMQVEFFRRILHACNGGGKLLSVHAVRSAGTVLDMMEAAGTLGHNRVIFHWFSGTSDELHRAEKAGAYFSVGPLMLRSKRGREYAKAIPLNRLVLETDFPMVQGEAFTLRQHEDALMEALQVLEELRGERLGEAIAVTSAKLLGV